MDFKFGNLFFSSNFDSGNLLNVEKVISVEENYNNHYLSYSEPIKTDYEFNVWTKTDCGGTEFENGNRTWFYFSVKGYIPGKTIKLTVKNLNRQQRLYSQGYSPLFRTETSNRENDKWLRVRYRPTWESNDNNFQLTFTHRFSELKFTVTYFAFCYPWSYSDCQKQLQALDSKFDFISNCNLETISKHDIKTIYYKRELITKSLEGRRVDLITVTDLEGLCNEREDLFDEKLFPERKNRPWKFNNKKVFVVTSRVHPGETPSSHVFNGFLNFILRPDDPRSIQLRKQFIFKLIPLLNPDGVFRGHYRTDTRGVNLNRVYLNPNFDLHPPIYAAKSLLVYHHICNSDLSKENITMIKSAVFSKNTGDNSKTDFIKLEDVSSNHSTPLCNVSNSQANMVVGIENDFLEIISHQPEVTSMSIKNGALDKEFNFMEYKDENVTKSQPRTNIPLSDDTHAVINNNLNDRKTIIDEFVEVSVDTESLKQDLKSSSEILLENNEFEIEEKTDADELNCQIKLPTSVNDANENQNPSIYRFFKSFNKSLSSTSSQVKGCHQWNIRGSKLSKNEKLVPPEPTQQAIRMHKKQNSSMIPLPLRPSIVSMKFSSKKMSRVTLDSAQLSAMKKELQSLNGFKSEPKIGNEGSDEESEVDCFNGNNESNHDSVHLCHPYLLDILPEKSGIGFYVDLHGHCAKRGCFVYGNCLESDKDMNDNVLYPKLISLNSPHFDFFGCNFSLRNMYTKDKKDGSSKEGSGRVAIWKHLGLIHSYTLESNYNTGRVMNAIPPASKDDGQASPPTVETSSLLPPKYTPIHFEDVGKAMAIASLDMSHTNPWSRIINSEYSTLQNLREYIKKYLNGQKTGFRQPISFRRPNRFNKQPSIKGAQSLNKTLSNQLEYSRGNKSQGSYIMSAPRKSQTTISFQSTNQNCNQIKPILCQKSTELAKQRSFTVTREVQRDPFKRNTTEQSMATQTNGQNVTSSLSKFDQIIKPDMPKLRKYPHNNSSTFPKSIMKHEMPDLVDSSAMMIRPMNCENYIIQMNNENNSASKPPEPYQKTCSDDDLLEKTIYNLLEKEKIDELKEILLDDKCYKTSRANVRTQSFNFDDRLRDVEKEQMTKKMLTKMTSFSSSDVSY